MGGDRCYVADKGQGTELTREAVQVIRVVKRKPRDGRQHLRGLRACTAAGRIVGDIHGADWRPETQQSEKGKKTAGFRTRVEEVWIV